MKKRRVVITGIGVVSPIGIGVKAFWENLLAGKTGMDRITLFDASSFPCQIAAEVKDFQPEKYLSRGESNITPEPLNLHLSRQNWQQKMLL